MAGDKEDEEVFAALDKEAKEFDKVCLQSISSLLQLQLGIN
jgi:hypothetical protein